jgi:hypothetical protein
MLAVTLQYAYLVITFVMGSQYEYLVYLSKAIIEVGFLCEIIRVGFGVWLGACVAMGRILSRIEVQLSHKLFQFDNVYALM